jgi:tetratricopeptide (TPR) repeat protein
MKIALCQIIKDDSELQKLKACIDSVKMSVDDVFITANGKSVSKIKKYCEDNKYHFSYFKWIKDFSAARNFNFKQATDYKEYDYLFWLDTDDVVLGGEMLKDIAIEAKEKGKDIVFFTYWYACTFNKDNTIASVDMQQNRERLLKPGVTYWKGRLHETPVPVSGVKENYTVYSYNEETRPFVVVHTNTDWEGKMDRNKEILEMQLKDERNRPEGADPRTLLYLMKIYAEQDSLSDLDKILEMGKEYLEKSGWDEERGVCWEQMGVALGRSGDIKGSIKAFHESIQEYPYQTLVYLRLANAYYNDKNYRQAQHWLDVAMKMEVNEKNASMNNIKAMKEMSVGLSLKLNTNVYKNYKKALDSAKLLYSVVPTEANMNNILYLEDIVELDEACKNTNKVFDYLDKIEETGTIPQIIDSLPKAIATQPFAIKWRQASSKPRVWGKDEICYFANFGGYGFEKWGPESLKKGIGGSETAVIELSKEWAKLGYKVTVYGDPEVEGEFDGVIYLPWYHFNRKDKFNIFIQWRNWGLAGKIKVKKFLVDLHDVWNGVDIDKKQLKHIDYFMVKSQFHREFAPNIPDNKFKIISNGLDRSE